MNKQELEKQAEALYADVRSFFDNTFELIDQIVEPQKVVVPEFIDSYIRYAKSEGMSLFIAMDNAQNKESEWIITNEETFARAWFFVYEVEQEKLYEVKLKANDQVLSKHYGTIGFVHSSIALSQSYIQFSKPDLEQAGFGWVFDCNGVKVVEVEE
ncbi:DUF1642 domain-containing protein [Streptococcus hyovaginalis]|uniref:DUF1642 domain-containing protein n=1 Tax=Streptococcus hyovaginalis TaxID=149015 RepID=UPI0014789FE9|nr:DUF1642 domain-containing protein [Streptococcus hyovaginalis]